MIRFSCPGCGATYSVDDSKAGKTGKCPKCQSQFVIPEAEAGAAPPPPPPPAPAPAGPDDPVEIAPCPGCQARLSVAAGDLGTDVECPYCKTVYRAAKPGTGQRRPLDSGTGSRPKPRLEEDRPSRRRDDEEDDRPARGSRRRDEDEDDDDRPRRRSRRDEDDEDDDRPRRRRRGRSRRDVPNYLVQSILVTLFCCLPLGIVAIIQSAKVNTLLAEGDYEGAVAASDAAKRYSTISAIIGAVITLGWCILNIVVAAAGGAGAGGR